MQRVTKAEGEEIRRGKETEVKQREAKELA